VNLDPGAYRLNAKRSGYLEMSYGSRQSETRGALLRLEAAQSVSGLKFRLAPAAVIGGTVYDSDGERLENAHVILARFSYQYGAPRVESVDSTDTDDQGDYKFHGLGSGKYYIAVETRSSEWGEVDHSRSAGPKEISIPTLYPGATDIAHASAIEVSTGARVMNVAVRLLKSRVFRVSGRVVNAPTEPFVSVSLLDAANTSVNDYHLHTATQNADGDFEFLGVPPGSYQLVANAESLQGRLPVTVVAYDVDHPSLASWSGRGNHHANPD
jgi:hypothetical protein